MGASTITNFPNGFANGVSIRGMPLLQMQPGQVFFVNNSTVLNPGQHAGSDNNRGTYLDPFATLAHALVMCVAGRGDIIFVGPGHTEAGAAVNALNLSVAGVAIIGLGSGALRPTFTLDTATTSTITVSANNISLQNVKIVSNFLNVAAAFTLTTAADFAVDNISVQDTSNILTFLQVFALTGTANQNDGFSLTNSYVAQTSAAGVCSLVVPSAAVARMTVAGNFYSALTTNGGAVLPFGANAMTNFRLRDNAFNLTQATTTATGLIITSSATISGLMANNWDKSLATTPLLVTAGTGLNFINNLHQDAADASGYLLPAADV